MIVEAAALDQTVTFDLRVGGRRPDVERSAIVDAASFTEGITPGAAGSIFGRGMMEDIDGVAVPTPNPDAFPSALSAAASRPSGAGPRRTPAISQLAVARWPPLNRQQGPGVWPTEFLGVALSINGVPAPIFALANAEGNEQINFQVPFEVGTGPLATLVVSNNGTTTTIVDVPVLPYKPAIFPVFLEGGIHAAALHADYDLVGPDNPAMPGEVTLLFLTGLGPTDPTIGTNRSVRYGCPESRPSA